MTDAQHNMLKMVKRNSGRMELGELVMECASAYAGGLAWRIADRTAGALLRRNWIKLSGDIVSISEDGLRLLEARS